MKKALFGLFASLMIVGSATAAEQLVTPIAIPYLTTPATDVIGLRLTIPFAESDSMTGLDIGFWGRSVNFYGLQMNVLYNKVEDRTAAIQLGLVNQVGDMTGLQVGIWNESGYARGFQTGLINYSIDMRGVQIGLINYTNSAFGYQFGLINVIRGSEVPFFPGINIGF